MDHALGLLLRLRLEGYLRRIGRSLRSVKGLLLTLVGSLLFLPMALASLFAPRVELGTQLALIRRYGPLGLLAFCLLNLLLASDERAVYFSPAEVDFLFAGPFRRRQLILYKMVDGLCSSLLVALFMTCVMAHHANAFLPAFVGLFLMIELLHLISMAFGLLSATVGALAFNRRRKLLLAAVAGLVGLALVPMGRGLFAADPWALLNHLERSPILKIVTWPFWPPVMAFTAGRLWPDLAVWTLLGLAVLSILAIVIIVLDAEYYEAAAASSARIYARARATRLGNMTSLPIKTRIVLASFPWWAGVGPNLWRQLTTAVRHPDRLVALLIFFSSPLLPFLLIRSGAGPASMPDVRLSFVMIVSLSFAATLIIGFDFRSDVDRMDTLKTLPIAPWALVIGEIAVPVLLMSLAEGTWLTIIATLRGDVTSLLDYLIFLLPYNAMIVEIESILFLWFPIRVVPGSTLDFPLMGRQFLLICAKLLVTGISVGLAVGLGALVYHFLVRSWTAALALAWLTMSGFALALIPLVVMAFQQYDVARDNPP